MQILKPLDHKPSLSRHAHSSQLLQPPSRLKPSHGDIKAAVSFFQITLDLRGFRAKSHQRSCCLNFCTLRLSCRTQVSRAGQVLVLVQLFLSTWTAVKRAGSRTAPDLKEGSKADLAERKKSTGKWAGSGEASERNEPNAQTKQMAALRLARGLVGQSRAPAKAWLLPKAQTDECRQRDGIGEGMSWMNGTALWLEFACYFRLETVPFAIVNTLFKNMVSMALSWRTKELICNSSVLGKASAAASSLN